MIVVPVKEGENIEKALKKFKRKFEKTGIGGSIVYRLSFCRTVKNDCGIRFVFCF